MKYELACKTPQQFETVPEQFTQALSTHNCTGQEMRGRCWIQDSCETFLHFLRLDMWWEQSRTDVELLGRVNHVAHRASVNARRPLQTSLGTECYTRARCFLFTSPSHFPSAQTQYNHLWVGWAQTGRRQRRQERESAVHHVDVELA